MRISLRSLGAGVVGSAAILASAVPAGSITGGEPDAGRHPEVGIVLFYQPDGRFRCSGTLVSPTVVLTAAHCTDGDIGKVAVSFDEDIATDAAEGAQNVPRAIDDPGDGSAGSGFDQGLWTVEPDGTRTPYDGEPDWVLGTALTHPGYSDFTDPRNWNDTGVIVLDRPVTGITPAQLAPESYLDAYRQPRLNKTIFDVVGYGTEVRRQSASGPQKPTPQSYPLIRRFAQSPGQKLTEQILQLNGNINDNRGTGGTCFGDSGGPVFLNGLVVGDTSYGYTSNCRYLGGYQRVDTPVVRDWLGCVLAAPDAATAASRCGTLEPPA